MKVKANYTQWVAEVEMEFSSPINEEDKMKWSKLFFEEISMIIQKAVGEENCKKTGEYIVEFEIPESFPVARSLFGHQFYVRFYASDLVDQMRKDGVEVVIKE